MALIVFESRKGTESGVLGVLPLDCRRTLSMYNIRILTPGDGSHLLETRNLAQMCTCEELKGFLA